MGGLLAADIALVFRHRIIGLVNFDVPFLGMHPGIIKAGLGSIFNAPPTPQDAIVQDPSSDLRPNRVSTLFNPKPADPNYNPSFPNDIHLPNRTGWQNSLHWLTKHYKDGLKEATKGLVRSHIEFGGAMADYRGLKDRYVRVRALEEEDEATRRKAHPQLHTVPRVRFVNYYTASTGRVKKPNSPTPQPLTSPSPPRPLGSQLQQHHDSEIIIPNETSKAADQQSHQQGSHRSLSVSSSELELTPIHPDPIASSPRTSTEAEDSKQVMEPVDSSVPADQSHGSTAQYSGPPDLPEIPPIPQEPPFVDLLQYTDKAQRKAAEKEYDQALKEYQRAVKARNKIIKERTKLEEKWQKEQQKAEKKKAEEREKEEKKRQQEREKEWKEQEMREQKENQDMEHMTREERQRQIEREQRQAEAEQREMEARQRQREADLRQGKLPVEETSDPIPAIVELEEDVGTIELGQTQPSQQGLQGPYGHYEFSTSRIMNQAPPDSRHDSSYTLSTTDSHGSQPSKSDSDGNAAVKPKKLKKFCMLPPKDCDGHKDPTWMAVFMENMDEVTAHTSLFFVNETYERLVGDVGARIEDWVKEADSMRLIRELSDMKA